MEITDLAEIRRQREAATRREPAVFIRMPEPDGARMIRRAVIAPAFGLSQI